MPASESGASASSTPRRQRRPSSRVSFGSLRLPQNDQVQQSSDQDMYTVLAADYIDKHRIWDLFASLLESLAIEKPANPIPFLVQQLQRPIGNDIRRSDNSISRNSSQ